MTLPEHPPKVLNQTVDRLTRVVEVAQELNSTLDLSELARIILRIVREETGIERGTVFVMSADRSDIRSLVAQEVDEEIHVRVGVGISGTVAETGEIIDIPDAYQDDRFDPSFDAKLGFHTRDIYCVPVRNRERKITGVLQLLNRSHELTEDDRDFLSDISVHIALAIENAECHLRILEEERSKQERRLSREIILIQSVRRHRLLLSLLFQRCPICLGGRVFRLLLGMRGHCEECGYYFWRKGRHILGSAFSAAVVTLVAAVVVTVVLPAAIGSPPSDPIVRGLLAVLGIVLTIGFFRVWRLVWMAVDLHSRPPDEADFDTEKGFLSVAQPDNAEEP